MKRRNLDAKWWLLALAAAVFLSFGGAASAQIATSKHDLSGGTGNTDQICIFCHTPHTTTAAGLVAPLWNRNPSTVTTWNMYDSGFSPSIDMTVQTTPQGVSMGCLSCHDGASAYDALIINKSGETISAGGPMTGGKAVGAGGDLTNDHPISVTYSVGTGANQDPDFVALATVQTSTLVSLFGAGNDQVECASCHDVHDNTVKPFLRVANTGSQICLSCHAK